MKILSARFARHGPLYGKMELKSLTKGGGIFFTRNTRINIVTIKKKYRAYNLIITFQRAYYYYYYKINTRFILHHSNKW